MVMSNEDPDNEFRVQVKMPVVDNAGDGTWARIASLMPATSAVSFSAPRLATKWCLVFWTTIPGRQSFWECSIRAPKRLPLTGSDDNNEKMYQSRSGTNYTSMMTKIILIETPAGKKVTLDQMPVC